MKFNVAKCQSMRVTKHPLPKQIIHDYSLHNQVLENVPSAKYWGITITDDLDWGQHINNVTSKATRTLGFLRRNLALAPKEIKVAAYQALVRSQLEYAAPIWNPRHQTEIDRIEKVQRTAARWACRCWRNQSHVGEMLEELQWPELQERRQQASLTFFFKIHNNLVTTDKNRYLSEAGGNRNTRSHPFQYHRPNAWYGWVEIFFLPQGNCNLKWTYDRSCLCGDMQLMVLSPKYNDIWLGRDMAWYACPWGLLVNSFNWGGFVKDLYCYLFLVCF